ncbi:MAG: hypothetical protein FLDDKLPJ_01138 [Phycisphaerae bacterium]|nr:hypothetical protein [Phycisphaerae bacterium]
MSKELRFGGILAFVVVLAAAAYMKFGRTAQDGDVKIDRAGDAAAKLASGTSKPEQPPQPPAPKSETAAPSETPAAPRVADREAVAKEEVLLPGRSDTAPAEGSSRTEDGPSLRDLRLTDASDPAGSGAPAGEDAGPPGEPKSGTPGSGAAPDAGSATATATDYYQTQPGDSYARIARIHYGDEKHADFLRNANADILDPAGPLRSGVRIRIPALPSDAVAVSTLAPRSDSRSAAERSRASTPSPAGSAGKTDPTSGKPSTGKPGRTYTVKPGETFYGIAKKELGSASRWKELLALNTALVDGEPKNLRPGQVITLPGS